MQNPDRQDRKNPVTATENAAAPVKHTQADTTAADMDGDLWDLPPIHKRTYRPPTFEGRTTDTIPLSVEDTAIAKTEAIPPKDPAKAPTTARPERPADRTYKTATYSTSREFQNRMQAQDKQYGFGEQDKQDAYSTFRELENIPKRATAGEVVTDREGEGWLISHVTVRHWINDFSFYTGFARDAAISHSKKGAPAEEAAYHAFVPQYSQMDSRQLAFYLWFRDNARDGTYLQADFSYILLYIFEIINLPELIPPEKGIRLICALWAHYRQTYQKLDTYLCEWIPDYALIHNVPLPDSVEPFLADIVRRTQFKEFYLDNMCPPGGRLSRRALEVLAGVLLEAYSDYDYKRSRYYTGGSREEYDRHILGALTAVLADAYAANRGMFVLDRVYRLTRDSYCGAIIQTENKRRIDVSFRSCIRSPDTRRFVTGVVKYAENRIRFRLRIKSKLSAADISAEDRALVDAYFGPDEVPVKKKAPAEEAAYLKLYEAETSGFDFSAAHAIEAASWVNTSRLTGEEIEPVPGIQADALPYTPEDGVEAAEGALDSDTGETFFPADPGPVENPDLSDSITSTPPIDNTSAKEYPTPSDGETTPEKEAVAALLAGQYTAWCREHDLFPGRMAEKINEIFLELVGDILIEADGNRYQLIEDYREDAESWSKTQM